MNPSQIGDIAEAQVMSALVSSGEAVLQPFGNRFRYDLAIDRNGTLVRVQVKSGRLRNGTIVVYSRSTDSTTKKKKNYRGEVEFIGVYCPDNNKCYLVPIELTGRGDFRLRVAPYCVNQRGYETLKWASDYEIKQPARHQQPDLRVACL